MHATRNSVIKARSTEVSHSSRIAHIRLFNVKRNNTGDLAADKFDIKDTIRRTS